MKQPANTDIAVLMLFFNRPDTFRQVFAQVKKARPSRLFLYQDGPRSDKDLPGIQACRDIVSDEQIDWDCEVRRHYCPSNQGCDPSGFLAQRWAFSMADKCIVLEDDVVPSLSFFPFCKEMLDRYEHDNRIGMVAGFNTDEVTTDCSDSYFFTSVFSIWGWASWSRVVNHWDPDHSFLDDPKALSDLQDILRQRKVAPDFLKSCRDHRATGKPYFETIFWSSLLLNSQLAIMPSVNLINNVGMSSDSTHFSGQLRTLPKAYRRIFTMKRHDLKWPLKHPRYVMEHLAYKERAYRRNAWGHPAIKVARAAESLCLNLRYGNWDEISKMFTHRLAKWTGRSHNV